MRNLATIVVAALLTAGVACAQTATSSSSAPPPPAPTVTQSAEPPLESARRIEQKEAINLVKKHKAVFVDVRPKEYYEQGHIKGAMSIPLGELINRLKEIPKGRMIITYCA